MKKWIIPVVIVAAGAAGFAVYQKQHADRQPENRGAHRANQEQNDNRLSETRFQAA